MLKKFFNIMKKNAKLEMKENEVLELEYNLDIKQYEEENKIVEDKKKENIINNNEIEVNDNFYYGLDIDESERNIKLKIDEIITEEKTQAISEDIFREEEYLKEIKIKRAQSIKAIDIYSEVVQEFKTHIECSKKLKVPIDYIKENLKYGYTDYLGQAINYLSEELNIELESSYIESSKTPIELFNILNNKIFTTKISEHKIDEILSSEKIEPIKMHYRFECIDKEYDEYFKIYKDIIKRGGKKRIELVNKNDEVIKRFKSLDDCAMYLSKEKSEVVNMLKYKHTKVGRHEIRYSLKLL
ncbi:MAG: hypothetical protein RSD47_10385 [Romboutsia sp.]